MKLDRIAVVESYIATLDGLARKASVRILNEENWAFLYGYTQSDIRHMLESLSLTQKQLNILNTRLEGYGKKGQQ
jgi:hypothetical protein